MAEEIKKDEVLEQGTETTEATEEKAEGEARQEEARAEDERKNTFQVLKEKATGVQAKLQKTTESAKGYVQDIIGKGKQARDQQKKKIEELIDAMRNPELLEKALNVLRSADLKEKLKLDETSKLFTDLRKEILDIFGLATREEVEELHRKLAEFEARAKADEAKQEPAPKADETKADEAKQEPALKADEAKADEAKQEPAPKAAAPKADKPAKKKTTRKSTSKKATKKKADADKSEA